MISKEKKIIEDVSKIAEKLEKDMYYLLQKEMIRVCMPIYKKLYECEEELDKYKMAFDILKVRFNENECFYGSELLGKYISFDDVDSWNTPEQYKLIKGLLINDNI